MLESEHQPNSERFDILILNGYNLERSKTSFEIAIPIPILTTAAWRVTAWARTKASQPSAVISAGEMNCHADIPAARATTSSSRRDSVR